VKIEKEIHEDRQATLTVEYASEEFESFKRRAAKRIAKNSKIPGFRPGKAPYNVIVNQFGEGAILQEAIDLLLDEDYGKILTEAELTPSGSGDLEKIENLDPPKLIFTIPLEPEIDLGNYRDIRKDYQPEDFDEGEVEKFIDRIRRNSATILPADHPAEEGDLVYFNLSGEFLNPAPDEDAMITDKTPQQVIIPVEKEETDNEWPYPGFARALIGIQDGETRELQHTYAEEDENEEFRGKTALFTIDVQSVKMLELPNLDEDFVQSIGNYETPEEFRENIDQRLREEHQNQYDDSYFDEYLEEITQQAMLNYPPQMLAHEEEHVLDDLKARLENQNMDFKTYLSLRGVEEEAFVADEIRPAAKQRLERSLIVDSLIDAENLKLDQEMLKDNIGEILNEVIVSGEAEEMQKQMGKDAFTRAISMEGVQKTMNTLLKNRLKLIATGQPIPEEVESDEEAEPILDAEQPDEETPVAITDVEKAEANEVDSQVDEVKETVESTEAESADGI
jgi:trigger factor